VWEDKKHGLTVLTWFGNALSIMYIVLDLCDVLRYDYCTVVINTLRAGLRYIRTLKSA